MIHHIENHIENMRAKPEHVRRQYAFGVSFVIVLIIFILWLASFGIGAKPVSDDGVKVKTPLVAVTASAADAIGGSFGYIKDLIFGANKTRYSSDNVVVSPGKN